MRTGRSIASISGTSSLCCPGDASNSDCRASSGGAGRQGRNTLAALCIVTSRSIRDGSKPVLLANGWSLSNDFRCGRVKAMGSAFGCPKCHRKGHHGMFTLCKNCKKEVDKQYPNWGMSLRFFLSEVHCLSVPRIAFARTAGREWQLPLSLHV